MRYAFSCFDPDPFRLRRFTGVAGRFDGLSGYSAASFRSDRQRLVAAYPFAHTWRSAQAAPVAVWLRRFGRAAGCSASLSGEPAACFRSDRQRLVAARAFAHA